MRDVRFAGSFLASAPVIATAALAVALADVAPDLYALVSQEDHWIEWSTVWAFLLAAAAYTLAARREYRSTARLPWFYAGLALFCVVVAMEEISWGQRLFGYRPPNYFLADNFQQELNFHNVVAADYRKWALQFVIVGYGIALPLLMRVPLLARAGRRLGVATPPLRLIPAFATTAGLYHLYPLELTGEWVELMLGLCMLLAATSGAASLQTTPARRALPRSLLVFVTPPVAATALGFATLGLTSWVNAATPEDVARAGMEIAALAEDFRHQRVATRCGVHKRVYTFVREYGQNYLREGAFAGRSWSQRDVERRDFFLDPWNMPYWVRHVCADGGATSVVTVYSFGPDRRRDSKKWELLFDDIGVVVVDSTAR